MSAAYRRFVAFLRHEPVAVTAVLAAVGDALTEGVSARQAIALLIGAVARSMVTPTT